VSTNPAYAVPLSVEAYQLMVHLRRSGVVVHYAVPMPTPANELNREGCIAVFLSKMVDQSDLARASTLKMPHVIRVTFAGFCPSIMYVSCRV
jgi:hypothetical protein